MSEKTEYLFINYTMEVLQKKFKLLSKNAPKFIINTPKQKLGKVHVNVQSDIQYLKKVPRTLRIGDSFLDEDKNRCVIISINKKQKKITLDFERRLRKGMEITIDYRLESSETIKREKVRKTIK